MEKQDFNTIVDFNSTLIDIDEGNKLCNDCGKEHPTHASINNGVVLCSDCASIHSTLNYSISYIRKLSDSWDNYIIHYMIMGGNSKFKSTMSTLGLDPNLPINLKYRSNAADYYRRNLKRMINNNVLIEIDYDNPNDICVNSQETFKEFENYIVSNNETHSTKNIKPDKIITKVGFFSKLSNTIYNVGKSGYNGLIKAGNYMANKTQPAADKIKEGANYIGNTVKNGTDYISQHAQTAFDKFKVKIGYKKDSNKFDYIPDSNDNDVNINNIDQFYNNDQNVQLDDFSNDPYYNNNENINLYYTNEDDKKANQ